MKKIILALLTAFVSPAIAQPIDSVQLVIDSLESSLTYQTGEIALSNGVGTITVPSGFRFLDAGQSVYVLEDLWGNLDASSTLGMLLPDNKGVLANDSWGFIITYDEMGYVKDDDADDIDYEELLEEMRTDIATENEQRASLGYETIDLVGWASPPYYDADKKVLHWAKEIRFGESPINTLNYNVRVLGRKGVLVLNAVASMEEVEEVKNNIAPVLASFRYNDGQKYSDFDPDIDEVAAWTIGGLVAGKVLAKAGFFAIILKYIKIIIIGLGAIGTAAWRWFRRKTEPPVVRTLGEPAEQDRTS